MKIQNFVRKPFIVEAVEITSENMDEVAAWSKGEVKDGVILVVTPNSQTPLQAAIGDFMTRSNRSFRVYPQGPFRRTFRLVEPDEVKRSG